MAIDETKDYEGKRIIPTAREILSDKGVDYRVYSSLQAKSKRNLEENHRYIKVKDLKMKPWAEELSIEGISITRQTLRTKLNYLVKAKIVEKKKVGEEQYYILPTNFQFYLLIDNRLLRFMTNTMSSNAIKTYFLYRSYTKYYGECTLCQKQIVESIGLSPKADNNDVLITDINKLLSKLGLIYIYKNYQKESGGGVKTPLTIKTVDENKVLKDLKLVK